MEGPIGTHHAMLFRPAPSQLPSPYGFPFPKIGVNFTTPKINPKLKLLLSQEQACKAIECKFGWYIHRVHPNKSPLKIWEKRERGLPNFWVPPIIWSRNG